MLERTMGLSTPVPVRLHPDGAHGVEFLALPARIDADRDVFHDGVIPCLLTFSHFCVLNFVEPARMARVYIPACRSLPLSKRGYPRAVTRWRGHARKCARLCAWRSLSRPRGYWPAPGTACLCRVPLDRPGRPSPSPRQSTSCHRCVGVWWRRPQDRTLGRYRNCSPVPDGRSFHSRSHPETGHRQRRVPYHQSIRTPAAAYIRPYPSGSIRGTRSDGPYSLRRL